MGMAATEQIDSSELPASTEGCRALWSAAEQIRRAAGFRPTADGCNRQLPRWKTAFILIHEFDGKAESDKLSLIALHYE
jgi:hypothetical protein